MSSRGICKGESRGVGFFILLCVAFSIPVAGAEIKKSDILPPRQTAYYDVMDTVLKAARDGDYQKAIDNIDTALPNIEDTGQKAKLKTQRQRVRKAEQIFTAIRQADEEKLAGTEIPIPQSLKKKQILTGKETGVVKGNDGQSLKVAVVIGKNGGSMVFTVSMQDLQISTVKPLLKRVKPKTYTEDLLTLFLTAQEFSEAYKLLQKTANSDQPLSEFKDWGRDWNKTKKIINDIDRIEQAVNSVNKGRISEAESLVNTIAQDVKSDDRSKDILEKSIKTLQEKVAEAAEKKEQKRNSSFKNFPVKAGQHKKVTCSDFKNVTYDVYLPPEYSLARDSKPLPIIYTFSPGGGGMVNHFKEVAADLQIIIIGNLHYKNHRPFDRILGSWHAMTTDVRERIRFDASAQIAAGFSGGACAAYNFAREYAPHISGVIAMGGWLGRKYDEEEYWHSRGLLLARLTGKNDDGASTWLDNDREYLDKFDVIIKDWTFPGGHKATPTPYLKKAIKWLLAEREKVTKKDRNRARKLFNQGSKALAEGREELVFNKCIDILMEHDSTPQAVAAERLISRLMRAESVPVSDFSMNRLEKTRELVGFFINKLYAGGLAGDKMTFRSAFHCLESLNVDTDKWMYHAVWIMATSEKEGVRYSKKAVKLSQQRLLTGNPDNDALVAAVAAYSAASKDEKAKRLSKKIDFDSDSSGGTTAENRYETIKNDL